MSLPRMSWHIGDYKRDTGHLRAAGHGAYFLLTMHYWATGGLPDDNQQLAAIACMTDKEWKAIRPTIEAFFQPGWRHKRIDKELAQATEKYERRSAAGRRGGNAKELNKHCHSNANGLLDEPPSNADPNEPHSLSNHNPIPKGSKEEDTADAVPSSPSSATAYAFESGIIRLNQKDFDRWKQSFSNLNLAAELESLVQYATDQGPQKWFFAVSGALAKRNREIGLRKEQRKTDPEFKWNGIEGVV